MGETKICTKCGQERPIEDFYWRDKAKGLRRSDCKYCHNNYVKENYSKKQDVITQLKSQCRCAKCGENRGYLLDYHHIDPSIKDEGIARMISNKNSYDNILNEINKCVVLCANCHREFHYLEKETSLTIEQYLKKSLDEIKQNYPQLQQKSSEEKLIYPQTQIKPKEIKYCSKCGKEIDSRGTLNLCKECYNIQRKEDGIHALEEKISREELKNLIRTTPFTTIGAMYNITDNSIKKWCDKFNLPRTKREINSYTDEQWALI